MEKITSLFIRIDVTGEGRREGAYTSIVHNIILGFYIVLATTYTSSSRIYTSRENMLRFYGDLHYVPTVHSICACIAKMIFVPLTPFYFYVK